MNPFSRLQQLARRASDDPDAALDQVLALACELLRMDLALLGTVDGGEHTVVRAVGADGRRAHARETTSPAEDVLCGHVGAGEPLLLADAAHEGPERPRGAGAGSYAGVLLDLPDLPDGSTAVLGLARATAHDDLGAWEAEMLQGLAPVVAELWTASQERAAARAEHDATAVGADDLAGLTRPLLDALHEMSGIPTTFLCRVDQEADTQEVLLVHRGGETPAITEGAAFGWTGSMCNLARSEGVNAVTDASERWPTSHVGVGLGLATHATVPVALADGSLWGTLCASDVVAHDDVDDHVPTLRLFARLIAAEVDRTAALSTERAAAAESHRRARTDELTGASARGTVAPWLTEALGRLGAGDRVVLAFVDVDRFKAVNDVHGHAAGDAVLVELVARLRTASRAGDLVARLGGDELVVAAHLPRQALAAFEDRVTSACTFELPLTSGGEVAVRCSTGFVTSDEAGGTDMLAVADARMYRHKARRARTGGASPVGAPRRHAALPA